MYNIEQKCLKRFMIIRRTTAKADVSDIMLKKEQTKDCKLGLVNGSRKCGICNEREGCAYAKKAIGNKVPDVEGILRVPSMTYPVQQPMRNDLVFTPFKSGFC
jgi:hypothetical protein